MTASFLSLAQALQAGKHTYLWDASDERGKHVSNGIYFVSLRTDSEHRCIKLAYIARNVMFSSPKDVASDDANEITEEDIIKAELKSGNPSRAALEQYERDARKLAKAIAMALPQIQPALYKAMERAGEVMRHKVKLAPFISDLAVITALLNTGCISKRELEKLVNTYSDFPYIYVPSIWGDRLAAAANKIDIVVVNPPYDEDKVKVVYGYNTKGEELIFDPKIPPEYPVFAITHEIPFIPPVHKTKGKDVQYCDLHVQKWRFWDTRTWFGKKGEYDNWPDIEPEFYTKLYISDGYSAEWEFAGRTNFYDVIKRCGKNNGSTNCDCSNVPHSGDHGYEWSWPGRHVGNTNYTYPYFEELQIWDSDDWEGWSDDKVDYVDFNTDSSPNTDWYWCEKSKNGKKRCAWVDIYIVANPGQ